MATFHFNDETTAKLQQLASQAGAADVEAYLRICVGLDAPSQPTPMSEDELNAEFESLLIDGPSLPDDFSRADIYLDHA